MKIEIKPAAVGRNRLRIIMHFSTALHFVEDLKLQSSHF